MNTNANAMINALLYFKEEGEFSSNWTRAVCRALEMSNFDDEYYFSSQSLEPSILFEVAQLTGIDLGALETLDYPAVGPMASIQWLLRELALAPHIQRLNLAFC
ncbi:MAG TPA: hypothetical protein PLF40_10910, partial [Kofleriaceae bacterium]|nr:hypothetical protein [Kofleriaceae bacterium]